LLAELLHYERFYAMGLASVVRPPWGGHEILRKFHPEKKHWEIMELTATYSKDLFP
jgi:hypothetical protein